MNSLTRIMSYDKTKIKNQENCNCEECVSVKTVENQTFEYPKLSDEEIEQIIFERYSDKDEKTKTFIRKALRKHGDRYDYYRTRYIKATEKVEIECRIKNHGIFLQTPHSHLNKRGCSICGGNRKLTLEKFIERANETHGVDRYNYSKVKYINVDTKICIICNNHNNPYEFWQTPYNHLKGQGCPCCYGTEKLTLEKFIERANKVHGEGTYDYSKVKYINIKTKVCIICKKHNNFEFWQTPDDHLRGNGCIKCKGEKISNKKKMTLEEFIEKANKIHQYEYDYSKSVYIDCDTKIEIICSKHGSFWQKPNAHLQGTKCPKCNSSKGEIVVRKFLIKNKIKFEEQKKFKDCKYKRQLKFDFYIPKYNLCIEFDGNCHFKKTNWSGKYSDEQLEKNLKLYQLRDKIKTDYCKKNKIVLIRLNTIDTIEEELTKCMRKYKIINTLDCNIA